MITDFIRGKGVRQPLCVILKLVWKKRIRKGANTFWQHSFLFCCSVSHSNIGLSMLQLSLYAYISYIYMSLLCLHWHFASVVCMHLHLSMDSSGQNKGYLIDVTKANIKQYTQNDHGQTPLALVFYNQNLTSFVLKLFLKLLFSLHWAESAKRRLEPTRTQTCSVHREFNSMLWQYWFSCDANRASWGEHLIEIERERVGETKRRDE